MGLISGYLLADPPVADPHRDADDHTWKPLRFLGIYRLFLGALFAILFQLDYLPQPLGQTDPSLFYATSLGYVAFALGALIAVNRRWPGFEAQVYAQVGADIVAITVFMHASGSMASGIGILLVVSIAAAGMLTEGRMARLFAALATFAVLMEQLYSHFYELPGFVSYPRAGMLGATLFATAALARALAGRIRESEALAEQRGLDLENMARLTEYVIQQMDAGVLVVDEAHQIRLMNMAAWRLLGRPNTSGKSNLASMSAALANGLAAWEERPGEGIRTLWTADSVTEVLPRFVRIGKAGYLIFLEDATAGAQQAQQLKLAALGRLTASIAHEVRNPLAAIGHAGQLLAESEHLDKADRRLTEIIAQQVQRVNTIIESILQLGRRERSQPEAMALHSWLERFVQELTQTVEVSAEAIAVRIEPEALTISFDPNHLRQILWNLCQNGLRHAKGTASPQVEIIARAEPGRCYIEVRDHGPGVPPEIQSHLFEPFFTTETGGTGLGLYISRELAQCNRARLEYLANADGKGGFRLSLPLPLNPLG